MNKSIGDSKPITNSKWKKALKNLQLSKIPLCQISRMIFQYGKLLQISKPFPPKTVIRYKGNRPTANKNN